MTRWAIVSLQRMVLRRETHLITVWASWSEQALYCPQTETVKCVEISLMEHTQDMSPTHGKTAGKIIAGTVVSPLRGYNKIIISATA